MNPVVLALETSGPRCSVAVIRRCETFSRRADVGNAHSTHLLRMVDEVLREADLEVGDCDAIAFGAGPGSFTGLRVASAAAQGLAFATGRPVVAIGTLEAIARSAGDGDSGLRTLLVAQDARMGEVYWGVCRAAALGAAMMVGPALARPVELRARIEAAGFDAIDRGVGNAWAAYGDAMAGLVGSVVHRDAPDAVDVAALAVDAVRDGRTATAAGAVPLYVRDDVARTTAEREAQRALAARPRVATANGAR